MEGISFAKMATESLSDAALKGLYTDFRVQYHDVKELDITLFDSTAEALAPLKDQSKHPVPLQRNHDQIGLDHTFAVISGSDRTTIRRRMVFSVSWTFST